MPRVLPPPSENVRVVARAGAGDWAGAWGAGAPSAGVLKDYERGTVWRARLLGRECVVKCTLMKPARRRIQAALRRSPAWRHWRNARWLRGRGFAAGEPLAILRGASGGRSAEALVLEYLPGRTVLAHLAAGDLAPRAEHAVARALGELAAGLARAGRLNRDAKPSNLVVVHTGAARAELALIDCADLRRCRRGDERAVVRALASAVIEPIGCGCAPRLALRARAVREAVRVLGDADAREAFRRVWRRVGAAVTAHGDPTPRDNPLARIRAASNP